MGKHIILKQILKEVKAAKFYTLEADEVTSHNVEHLVLCTQFVDSHKYIRKEFLTFLPLQRISGEQIDGDIIAFLTENNIPVTYIYIQGQGYDDASSIYVLQLSGCTL